MPISEEKGNNRGKKRKRNWKITFEDFGHSERRKRGKEGVALPSGARGGEKELSVIVAVQNELMSRVRIKRKKK